MKTVYLVTSYNTLYRQSLNVGVYSTLEAAEAFCLLKASAFIQYSITTFTLDATPA